MKKSFLISLIIYLSIVIVFSGCTDGKDNNLRKVSSKNSLKLRRTVFSLSTVINMTAYDVALKDSNKVQHLFDEAERIFAYYNKEMNPGDSTSLLSVLNESPAGVFHKIPSQLQPVLKLAKKISAVTDTTFDAAVYAVVQSWGFLDDSKPAKPDSILLQQLLKNSGMKNVLFKEDSLSFLTDVVKLGLGGIAKGFAVDSVASYFKENGLVDFIVEAGGDLLVGKANQKVIGIRHPRENNLLLDTLTVRDVSVATSGDYERFFMENGKRFCHIINPHTGYGVSDIVSATVIAENAALADAYATSVFVMGQRKGRLFLEQNHLSGIIAFIDKQTGELKKEYVDIKGKYKK